MSEERVSSYLHPPPVIDRGGAPSQALSPVHDVSYVDQVRRDASGKVVPLHGWARLQILTNRADDVTTGKPTYRPANPSELVDLNGRQSFRQVAFGAASRGGPRSGSASGPGLPFRVFIVTSSTQPPRAVIDVARTGESYLVARFW